MPYYARRYGRRSYGKSWRRQVRKVVRSIVPRPEMKHIFELFESTYTFAGTAPLILPQGLFTHGPESVQQIGDFINIKMIQYRVVSFMGEFINPTANYNEWNVPQGMRWMLVKHVYGLSNGDLAAAFEPNDTNEHMSYSMWDFNNVECEEKTRSHFFTPTVNPLWRNHVKIVAQKRQVYNWAAFGGNTPRYNPTQEIFAANTLSIPLWDAATNTVWTAGSLGTVLSGSATTAYSGITSGAGPRLKSYQRPFTLSVKFPGKGWRVPLERFNYSQASASMATTWVYTLIGFPMGYDSGGGAASTVDYRISYRIYYTDP